jgi:hypothetical protein
MCREAAIQLGDELLGLEHRHPDDRFVIRAIALVSRDATPLGVRDVARAYPELPSFVRPALNKFEFNAVANVENERKSI